MNDMKPTRAKWPASWDKSLEAACTFYRVRAHEASHSTVLLLNAQGEPFAKVPVDINLQNLNYILPLLLDTFELGLMNGEGRIKARIRNLLRADDELKNTFDPG